LERQLEPKPEENEGHFRRAPSSNESVFPVRIEFYKVVSQLPLRSPNEDRPNAPFQEAESATDSFISRYLRPSS
jgi:hypothetical protein